MTKSKEAETESGKAKFESKYDPKALKEYIHQGMDASHIMKQLGIKHKQTLKQYVLRLINDERTFYEVKGLYLKSAKHPRVNAKGEIKLNLSKLDLGPLEIIEGDEFSITVEDERIILVKV